MVKKKGKKWRRERVGIFKKINYPSVRARMSREPEVGSRADIFASIVIRSIEFRLLTLNIGILGCSLEGGGVVYR